MYRVEIFITSKNMGTKIVKFSLRPYSKSLTDVNIRLVESFNDAHEISAFQRSAADKAAVDIGLYKKFFGV